MKPSFTNILYNLIHEHGLTIDRFNEEIGLGHNTIRAWTVKDNLPSSYLLLRIADYFDVSTDYLLGRTEDRYSHK